MKLSRALALASDDLANKWMRAVAKSMAEEQRSLVESRNADQQIAGAQTAAAAILERARRDQTNLKAMQASRSLLVRTIAMLK